MLNAPKSHGNAHGKLSPQAPIQVGLVAVREDRCGVQIALLHVLPYPSRLAETIGPTILPLPAGEGRGEGEYSKQIFRACQFIERPNHSPPKALINPRPKSTLPNPKSTVDLGCELLIRVENALPGPLFPGYRHAFSPTTTGQLTGADRNRTATHQKIYPAPPLKNVSAITIGLAILPLPAGDLSRLGSGERNLAEPKAVRPGERERASQRRGEGESSKPEPVSIHYALNTASKRSSTPLNRWAFLTLHNSTQTCATPRNTPPEVPNTLA